MTALTSLSAIIAEGRRDLLSIGSRLDIVLLLPVGLISGALVVIVTPDSV